MSNYLVTFATPVVAPVVFPSFCYGVIGVEVAAIVFQANVFPTGGGDVDNAIDAVMHAFPDAKILSVEDDRNLREDSLLPGTKVRGTVSLSASKPRGWLSKLLSFMGGTAA